MSADERIVQDGEARFTVPDRKLRDISETRRRLTVNQVIEKAVLNEASVEERLRSGRRRQIRDKRNRLLTSILHQDGRRGGRRPRYR